MPLTTAASGFPADIAYRANPNQSWLRQGDVEVDGLKLANLAGRHLLQ